MIKLIPGPQKPSFEEFELTKEKYEGVLERNRKVSAALTHYLPLAAGAVFGILIYIIYYKPFTNPSFLEIVKSFFVFGGFGILFLGLPLLFFKVVEKIYFKFLSKRPEQINITNYEEELDNYDYWRLRTDEDLWMGMHIAGFIKELEKAYAFQGYQTIKRDGLNEIDREFDFLLYKDYRLIPVKCFAQKKPAGKNEVNQLYESIRSLELKEAVCASVSGFTRPAFKFAEDKNIKLISPKEITAMLQAT